MGVKIVLNHKVDDVLAERDAGRFDAVFVAIGAHVGKHVDIPARDAVRVLDAVALLRDVGTGDAPLLGRRVVVYGGGNTAMDAARTARRLGADEALIVYRRDRAHMPAHEFEADEALAEGVKIKWLTTIKEIVGPTLTVERMALDDKGRPQPTGEFETLQADAVVLALGQDTDSGFLRGVPGVEFKWDTVVVDRHMMTGHPGHVCRRRHGPGRAHRHRRRRPRQEGGALHRRLAARRDLRQAGVGIRWSTFDMLQPAGVQRRRSGGAAPSRGRPSVSGFDEVLAGLTEHEARHEAQRCLSCGNCFECDNCYAACPEDAIVKLGLGQGYSVDRRECTGCAVCFEQCPCHAIEMVAEPVAWSSRMNEQRSRGSMPGTAAQRDGNRTAP